MHAAAEAWINPLIEYAALAAGFCACLYLFFSMKVELRHMQKGADARSRELAALESAVADLREKLSVTEELRTEAAASHLDAGKRTQALRMHRRGEQASTIAGALGIPINEVELLVRMQSLAAGTR